MGKERSIFGDQNHQNGKITVFYSYVLCQGYAQQRCTYLHTSVYHEYVYVCVCVYQYIRYVCICKQYIYIYIHSTSMCDCTIIHKNNSEKPTYQDLVTKNLYLSRDQSQPATHSEHHLAALAVLDLKPKCRGTNLGGAIRPPCGPELMEKPQVRFAELPCAI